METSHFINIDYHLHVNEDYCEEYPFLAGTGQLTIHSEEETSKDIGSIGFTIFYSNTLNDSL